MGDGNADGNADADAEGWEWKFSSRVANYIPTEMEAFISNLGS